MRPPHDTPEEEVSASPLPLTPREVFQGGALGERAIQEAMRRGDFDNLPGRGKPLSLDPNANPADALVAGILKEADVRPEWIELERRIDRLRGELDQHLATAGANFTERFADALDLLARWQAATAPAAPPRRRWPGGGRADDPRRLEARLRELLAETGRRREAQFAACFHRGWQVNQLLRRYNLIVPIAARQRALLSLDELAARFVAAWPSLRLAGPPSAPELRCEALEPPRPAPPPTEEEAQRRKRDPLRAVELRALTRGRKPPPIG